MAIDATTIDSSAVPRTAARERPSPVINDGHGNEHGVEIQGDMSFWDVLDVINPLQHIPIVSTIYRNLTGDTIQPSARVIGGMLYGGALGGMAAIANAVVEEAQGQDIPDQIMTSLGFGDGAHPTAPVAVADASGGPATAGSPAEPPTAAQTAAQAAAGQPIRLGPDAPATTASPAAQAAASPSLTAQLAAGAHGTPAAAAATAAATAGKMPARDTPLASSTMVKHAAPKFAAPLPGSIPVGAQAFAGRAAANGNPAPADPNAPAAPANANGAPTPDTLSDTMMRNLAKYEQSRKAAQSTAPAAVRVSS